MTINREVKNFLLTTNLYPTKDDLEIWKIAFCTENPSIDEEVVGDMIKPVFVHDIRKKAHNQINDYLKSDDAKMKVPDLYNIARGGRSMEPTNRVIYLSNVQHLPLAYSVHGGLPSEKAKTTGYDPNFAQQGRQIPNDFKGSTLSGLFMDANLASQVFYVAMLIPWKGRQTMSFAEQAGLADSVGWNANMLIAAISLVRTFLWRNTLTTRLFFMKKKINDSVFFFSFLFRYHRP